MFWLALNRYEYEYPSIKYRCGCCTGFGRAAGVAAGGPLPVCEVKYVEW